MSVFHFCIVNTPPASITEHFQKFSARQLSEIATEKRVYWLTCIFANAMQQSSSNAIILINLVDLESPMLYTKIQPQSFLSTGEEDF